MSLCSPDPHTDPSRREGECIFKDSTEPRYTTSRYALVPTLESQIETSVGAAFGSV